LTIGYNPSVIRFEALCNKIKALKIQKTKTPDSRKLNIPVCYEEDFAIDLKEVKSQTGLSTSEIINIHTSTLFQVYMMGFLPGFPYLGKVPEALFCKRKDNPRLKVPARSVGLAGYQTGIYPSQAPGGWQIIGQTPLDIFDASKAHPFLFRAGDQVQFQEISGFDFENIEKYPGSWEIL
jgi:KipI family sensor histidine kinase inhibitor